MKAIFFNFIYTFVCILTLYILAGSENYLVIAFSYLLGDIGAFVYLCFKEEDNETKS